LGEIGHNFHKNNRKSLGLARGFHLSLNSPINSVQSHQKGENRLQMILPIIKTLDALVIDTFRPAFLTILAQNTLIAVLAEAFVAKKHRVVVSAQTSFWIWAFQKVC
jgi:hypothetical protein